MQMQGDATRVTIYIGESDRYRGKNLYTAILELLRREGAAGATVHARPGRLRRQEPHPYRQHRIALA